MSADEAKQWLGRPVKIAPNRMNRGWINGILDSLQTPKIALVRVKNHGRLYPVPLQFLRAWHSKAKQLAEKTRR